MATLKITLKDKQLSNGLFPIYLRVTVERKRKLISIGYACEKSDWNENKSEFRKSYPEYIQKNAALIKIKNRAEDIFSTALGNGEALSIEEFEEIFFKYKNDNKISVNQFWDDHVESLNKARRTGNAKYYKECKISFLGFLENKVIYFKSITPALLMDYEVYLRSRGSQDSGIAVRMRAIRSIYNTAIIKGVAFKDNYPFNSYKISKLKAASNKRAISFENIQKIRSLDLSKEPTLINSRNYFVFSYYTRGMNFFDMMKLQWKDIIDDNIHYQRSKTKINFVIKITQPISEILLYYKKLQKSKKYVFPLIVNEKCTPQQLEYRKHKTLQKFNNDLQKIAKLCEIETKLTSYVARHSFATNLKQKGVSTDIISEALGHQNVAITQTYLKELESSVIESAVEQLL
ncbi:site-specific integrase [Epilithonimonas sp.]|uniref:site-specific integrase n=1 Tax=Epilithonimonas sp. TaxID=2894511 RepID=UPI00289EBF19|nr:site-specific integrase [Epilithonimonas sp.]